MRERWDLDLGEPSAASPPGSEDRIERDGASVCVGIASRGRPEILAAVVEHLRHQTWTPASVLVCCPTAEDAGRLVDRPDVTVLLGPPGLARQRNQILDNVPDETEIIAFFDDDFVAHRDWIEAAARALRAHPAAAAVTGHVILDGIKGPGIPFDVACTALHTDAGEGRDAVASNFSPYGCNMAFRRSAIRALRFDERLVLYGWLEDRDFGGALIKAGWDLIKTGAARGVHMGAKTGRIAGRRLGYSQVMNPVYMARKGTMSASAALNQIARNALANLVRSLAPEPYVDRRGRLRGNVVAVADLLRWRFTPERAERL